MAYGLKTDVGLVRSGNEDCAFADDARRIYAVADGMGGHNAGEVASALAIQAVGEMTGGGAEVALGELDRMVKRANYAIISHSHKHRECEGMGTTLSVLWLSGGYAYIAHVGDSRIYRLRQGKLEQITVDHSLVEELVRAHIITPEEARVHPRRNIITRALGVGSDSTPDLLAADAKPDDVWLLCSDGLNSMVEDKDIEAILKACAPQEACEELVRAALSAGGRDNVTVVVAKDGEE